MPAQTSGEEQRASGFPHRMYGAIIVAPPTGLEPLANFTLMFLAPWLVAAFSLLGAVAALPE